MERIGVEVPIVQAGMGGGLAGHELAAVVSDAGELGTIGILGPESLVGGPALRRGVHRADR
jgi:nitronate monooxygenase